MSTKFRCQRLTPLHKRTTNIHMPKAKRKPGAGRPRVKDPRQSLTIRMSQAERDDLARMAEVYTGGNTARWARFALLNCIPTPEQAEALRST